MNRQLNPNLQSSDLALASRLCDHFLRGLHSRSMETRANEGLKVRPLGIGWAADHTFTVAVSRRLERLEQTLVAGNPKP